MGRAVVTPAGALVTPGVLGVERVGVVGAGWLLFALGVAAYFLVQLILRSVFKIDIMAF